MARYTALYPRRVTLTKYDPDPIAAVKRLRREGASRDPIMTQTGVQGTSINYVAALEPVTIPVPVMLGGDDDDGEVG